MNIEEIKKEINDNYMNVCFYKKNELVIDKDRLFKILDKYKDKEIKFEDGSSKYGTVKVPELKIEDIKNYNNQPDYKSAFEEFQIEVKEQINLLQNWCGDCSICKSIPEPNENIKYSDLNNKLQELSKKYNLGGE